MHCRKRTRSLAIAGCLTLALCSTLLAAPASERLLPGTTKGFISVGNVDHFRAEWAKTQIGQLMADPIMQPFVEDFRRSSRTSGTSSIARSASPGTT